MVLVRENPAVAPVGGNARRRRDHQHELPGASGEGWEGQAAPWCGRIAVLVTSLDEEAFPTLCMPRLVASSTRPAMERSRARSPPPTGAHMDS